MLAHEWLEPSQFSIPEFYCIYIGMQWITTEIAIHRMSLLIRTRTHALIFSSIGLIFEKRRAKKYILILHKKRGLFRLHLLLKNAVTKLIRLKNFVSSADGCEYIHSVTPSFFFLVCVCVCFFLCGAFAVCQSVIFIQHTVKFRWSFYGWNLRERNCCINSHRYYKLYVLYKINWEAEKFPWYHSQCNISSVVGRKAWKKIMPRTYIRTSYKWISFACVLYISLSFSFKNISWNSFTLTYVEFFFLSFRGQKIFDILWKWNQERIRARERERESLWVYNGNGITVQ